MRRVRTHTPVRPRRKPMPVPDPLTIGEKLRDGWNRQGEVLDFACQYAHPKADPVYSYLIRWEDGQVQAVSEAAFVGDRGLERLDS